MPTKIILNPGKYIQGPDELKKLPSYLEGYGRKAFVIAGERTLNLTKDMLSESFSDSNIQYVTELFRGECSQAEIDRLVTIAKKERCDITIGIGGGKALDTAKAVVHFMDTPVIPSLIDQKNIDRFDTFIRQSNRSILFFFLLCVA